MNFDSEQKMSFARYLACKEMPYFAAAIYSLIPRWSEQVVDSEGHPTMGVTAKGVLYVNPKAFDAWSQGEVAAALIHEAQHLLMDHNGRRAVLHAEPQLWNIAADMAINSAIVEGLSKNHAPTPTTVRFPKGYGILPEKLDPPLPAGLCAEDYYFRLKEMVKEVEVHVCCGSGSGNPLPNEPGDSSAVGGGKAGGEGEERDRGAGGRSESELASMRRQVAQQVQEASAKAPGSVPGHLLRWAEEALRPPTVRWQDRLARACRSSITYRAGVHDYHYQRPSRRQPGVGSGVGHPVLPSMRMPVPRVAVAVDTSGSMGQAEIHTALSELSGVIRATGTQVDFLACDAAVHGVTSVRDWREVRNHLKGGGGTDFNPIFQALDLLRPRPNLVVVMTDGFGPAPAHAPAGMDVVWLLIGENSKQPVAWGTGIKVG